MEPMWAAVILAAVALGGWAFARRYGGGAALESLERSNGILERRVHELEDENGRQARRIAELEAKTDLTLAIGPVLESLRSHESQAAARSEATLRVLGMIAERLGPEPAAA